MAKAPSAIKELNDSERSPERFAEIVAGEAYAFNDFRLEIASFSLRRGDELIPLAPTSFGTLVLLLRHAGQTVTKDELMARVWPNSFVSEESVTQCVYSLRRTLGDDSAQPKYIATLPRRGYRFIAPVRPLWTVEDSSGTAERAAVPPDVAGSEAAGIEGLPQTDRRPPETTPRRIVVPRFVWIAAAAALVAASAAVVWSFARPRPAIAAPPVLLTQNPPSGTSFASGGVLSPDGQHMAFVTRDNQSGRTQVWVSSLQTGSFRPMPGTEGATRPFWSPDSRAVGFFAAGQLKTIGVDSDSPHSLTSVGATVTGGTWSSKGTIVWSELWAGLYSVPESGGRATALTTLGSSPQETAHRWPQFLPDGRHFTYFVTSPNAQHAGVYVGALDSNEKVRLLDGQASAPIYSPTGHLLFVRERVLIAQAFDASTLTLKGQPVSLAADISGPTLFDGGTISASANGLLAFERGAPARRLSWFTMQGEKLRTLNVPASLNNPSISPDAAQAVAGSQGKTAGVWLVDLTRAAGTRLGEGSGPLFAPDGKSIAYTSGRINGVLDIFVMPITGPTPEKPLLQSDENKFLHDWSRDGKYLLYVSTSPITKQDLWVLPLDRGTPFPFLKTSANEIQGRISPNGRWIAYVSDESGTWEVYLSSFPKPSFKRTVSIGGGSEPQWAHDGKTLYYLRSDNTLIALPLDSGAVTPQPAMPRALFPLPISGNAAAYIGFYRNHYAVAPDDQHMIVAAEEDEQPPISVMVGWNSAINH